MIVIYVVCIFYINGWNTFGIIKINFIIYDFESNLLCFTKAAIVWSNIISIQNNFFYKKIF